MSDIANDRSVVTPAHADTERALPPPSPHAVKRIAYLDGWRGLSIMLVLFGHFVSHTEPIAKAGVQLFFALSGRLMADILFVERFPLLSFYKRRFSRVYPGVFVFVVLVCLLLSHTRLTFKPLAALLALSFSLNYALIIGHGVPAIENLWSLCIEEHSYVLLGIAAFLLRGRAQRVVIWALAAVAALSLLDGVVSAALFHQGERAVTWRTDTQLAPIFLAASAYLLLRTRRIPGWVPLAAVPAALVAQAISPMVGYSVGTILLSLAIASIDDAPPAVRDTLSLGFLTQLGIWSYSIYLWQQPFFWFARDGVIGHIAGVALAAAAGLTSFYLVEQPARRWLNRRWAKPAPRPAPLPSVEPAPS